MKAKIFLLLFLVCQLSLAQTKPPALSHKSTISIITCGSGAELYSIFGHTAIRIQDSQLGIDNVYNYGSFDFNTPNFYGKFATGKLLYSLNRERFEDFLYTYEFEKRWVKEQILNLNWEEKNNLFSFLENNYLPENRDYKYDFLFNNCATKKKDILVEVFGDKIKFNENHLKEQFTFRELLHQKLTTNTWSAFGINLALGAVIDRKATPQEHMFLPDYVMFQMANTQLGDKALVQRERDVLKVKNYTPHNYFLATPLFWLLLLMLFVIIITYIDYKNKTRSKWLDFSLFFITGITGLVIFFLWFLTDHTATAWNLNILWAFPINIYIAFYTLKNNQLPKNFDKYLRIILILLALSIALWAFKIQIFSPLIIPILILLGIRYLFLHYTFKKGELV